MNSFFFVQINLETYLVFRSNLIVRLAVVLIGYHFCWFSVFSISAPSSPLYLQTDRFHVLFLSNLWYPCEQRRRLITHANAKCKSEKFPPPHLDGAVGYPSGSLYGEPAFDPADSSLSSTSFMSQKLSGSTWSGPLLDPVGLAPPRRKKQNHSENGVATSRSSARGQKLTSASSASLELRKDKRRSRGKAAMFVTS